jgi:hypothetical protein
VDAEVIRQLQEAGVDTPLEQKFPVIGIEVTDRGEPVPLGDRVMIFTQLEEPLFVFPKPITALFAGSTIPPDFSRRPTPEYMPFSCLIELTAANSCSSARKDETDQEFQRLYRRLWKRPESSDSNPLFSYLQGAVRLYMSLRDTSRAEFEAIAARLAKSAKTFSMGDTSRNYFNSIMRLIR